MKYLYLCLISVLCACQATPHSFAVKDVRLFDGDEVRQQMTILVTDGRIAAVGDDIDLPPETTVIDGRGKTLLPGLIDSHTHAFGDALTDALRFGVTTELDMFTDEAWAAERRKEQKAGPVTSRADLFSAGTLVTAAGGHGTEYGIPIPTLAGPDGAEAFVEARLDEGSDYIKIIIDDGALYGLDLPTLDQDTLRAVVTATHVHGALAVVHVMTKEAASKAVSSGADALMHIFADQPIDDALVDAILRKEVFVVPTLSTIESIAGHPGGSAVREEPQFAPFLSPEQHRNLAASFPPAYGRSMKTAVAMAAVRRLFLAGVPILAGTDAPNPGTAHGVSLHRELELLVDAGLSPVDALRAATSLPADAFHLPDRGRIAPGLKADLVLVEGDPSTVITSTRTIVSIWKDGIEVLRELPKPTVTSEETLLLQPVVVSNFDDGSLKISNGFGWAPSTDSMMGGASTVDLAIEDGHDDGRYLRVRGTIVGGATFPWAGPILFPGHQPMDPVDGTAVTALTFSARGHGVLRVLVFAESLGWIPAEYSLHLEPRWNESAIPFTAFEGVDRNGIKAILFSGGPGLGDFEFDIDEVGFR
jgi:imidazolonepropionase-like amidohydrolase